MTRSCARRNFAAETIFMAFVICCVLRTERMRRRMSIRLGIGSRGLLLLCDKSRLELLDRVLQLAAQRVIEGLLFPDLRPNRWMGIIDKCVKILLEPAAPLHGQIVKKTGSSREDDGD